MIPRNYNYPMGLRILAGDIYCSLIQAGTYNEGYQQMREIAVREASLLLSDVDAHLRSVEGEPAMVSPSEEFASSSSHVVDADDELNPLVLDAEFGGI